MFNTPIEAVKRYLKFLMPFFWIIGFVYLMGAIPLFESGFFGFYAATSWISAPIFYSGFIVLYGLYTNPLMRFLQEKIEGLISADSPDPEMRRICAALAVAVVIGGTLIWMLAALDFSGHWIASQKGYADKLAELKAGESLPMRPTWGQVAGANLGTIGDFFGGVLNPILTFGTLTALAVTIVMQRVQLKEAKDGAAHAKVQAFETTFFNMLALHSENVQSLSFDPATIPNADPMQLSLFRRIIYLGLGAPTIPPLTRGRSVFLEVLNSTARGASGSRSQLEVYKTLQIEHNDVLGHYFRHLYQILDLVDQFRINGKTMEFEVRKRYTNILRAQLSSHELAVLLMNCVKGMVDEGRFQGLLIKYQFLEHLPLYYNGGRLRARGIPDEDEAMLFEYFAVPKNAPEKRTAGAFGQHPLIKVFLETKFRR